MPTIPCSTRPVETPFAKAGILFHSKKSLPDTRAPSLTAVKAVGLVDKLWLYDNSRLNESARVVATISAGNLVYRSPDQPAGRHRSPGTPIHRQSALTHNQPFSSRRRRLDHAFLANRLANARSYIRIAGYFRSSIFELVGKETQSRMSQAFAIANSTPLTSPSRGAREIARKAKWNRASPEVEALLHRDRYRKLHQLLTSRRVKVYVVPGDRVFVHGKAGVIESREGQKTCFSVPFMKPKVAWAGLR